MKYVTIKTGLFKDRPIITEVKIDDRPRCHRCLRRYSENQKICPAWRNLRWIDPETGWVRTRPPRVGEEGMPCKQGFRTSPPDPKNYPPNKK